VKRNTQVNLASSYEGVGWGEGFVAILIVEKKTFQETLRRTKALVITRNRNKAADFASVKGCRYEHSFIIVSKRRRVNLQQILRFLNLTEGSIFTFRGNDLRPMVVHQLY
jgi:hypothetical protein